MRTDRSRVAATPHWLRTLPLRPCARYDRGTETAATAIGGSEGSSRVNTRDLRGLADVVVSIRVDMRINPSVKFDPRSFPCLAHAVS